MNDLRLRCVECSAQPLTLAAGGAMSCPSCGRTYPVHPYRKSPVLLSRRSRLAADKVMEQEVDPRQADLAAAARHWKTGDLTGLLKSCSGTRLLNYGCGDGGDRVWLEANGYDVCAIDVYPGVHTDYICDGHDLPFADESFEIVASIAVFEHLYQPFQAASEIYRVLRKGGAVVGSAAFLEPFHADSHFHMTHLGLREVLTFAGFHNIEIRPGWSYLEALNSHYFLWNRCRPVRAFTGAWNRLEYALGKGLWKLGYAVKGKPVPEDVSLGYCGSLVFKAVK
jgi:SAM-dependent methyltransferase